MDSKSEGNQDSVSVEVGPTGLAVDVKGGTVTNLSAALVEMLSPFTNAAGYMGDRIAATRRIAAIKAAAKAIAMLKSEGITTGNVPPKILLPWLEGASLEEESEGTLQDAWAGLLARAVKSSDAVNISYIETLKKLGKDEAELLMFFATDTSPSFAYKFYDLNNIEMISSDNPLFGNALMQLDGIDTEEGMQDFMDKLGIQGMCQVIFYSLDRKTFRATPFFEKNEHTIANLEHLGLIKIRRRQLASEKRTYTFVWFQITKFAFDLFWACQGELTGVQRRDRDKLRPVQSAGTK